MLALTSHQRKRNSHINLLLMLEVFTSSVQVYLAAKRGVTIDKNSEVGDYSPNLDTMLGVR